MIVVSGYKNYGSLDVFEDKYFVLRVHDNRPMGNDPVKILGKLSSTCIFASTNNRSLRSLFLVANNP